MNKYKVRFNTHFYVDGSDKARLATLLVFADTEDDAREVVRKKEKHKERYIGMIHDAELIKEKEVLL